MLCVSPTTHQIPVVCVCSFVHVCHNAYSELAGGCVVVLASDSVSLAPCVCYQFFFFYRSCLDFYQGPCSILTTELIHKCIQHHTSSVTLIGVSACLFGFKILCLQQ